MKKIIILLFTICLFNCSNNTEDSFVIEKTNSETHFRDFFCGAGHHLEVYFETEIFFFNKGGAKSGTCGGGFGFCFGSNLNWGFNCVKNTITTVANKENVNYDNSTETVKALGIAYPENNEMIFYFDNNIVNSTNHIPSDFDTLDVGKGFYITNNILLVEGSYSKIIEGDYFKYIIPYVDEK